MRKISVLTIVGVLLAGACGDGFAASSLNTADAHSPKVQRAASMHFGGTARSASLGRVISPKQVGMKSVHGTATTPMARSASLSRSSVGRYVGASKEQSVSMAALPDSIAALPDRVTDAEGRLDTAEGRLDTAETNITDLQDAVSNLSQTQADWNETDDTSPSYIQNKPEIPAAQVQADWEETDSTSMAYIQNKPTNVSEFTNNANYITAADVPAQVNADWNATSGAGEILNKPTTLAGYGITDAATSAQGALADTAVQSGDLATVATTGDYDDLSNKPTIPAAQVQSDWNATTGMGVILNKPTIPAAQVNADWDAPSGVAQILNKPTLSAVATSGAYSDLSGTPNLADYATTSQLATIEASAQSAAGTVSTFESRITAIENYLTSIDPSWNETTTEP
ncbi:MAG: hypothetical protein K6B71_04005 [Alphaproteobacteria bacterium]|nr:hypothetical protein [Alphaproteobacteria bacterium]